MQRELEQYFDSGRAEELRAKVAARFEGKFVAYRRVMEQVSTVVKGEEMESSRPAA